MTLQLWLLCEWHLTNSKSVQCLVIQVTAGQRQLGGLEGSGLGSESVTSEEEWEEEEQGKEEEEEKQGKEEEEEEQGKEEEEKEKEVRSQS